MLFRSALQGQNPLTGAGVGAGLGLLSSTLSGLGSTPTGAGGAAGASALPGAAAAGPLDVTQALGVSPEVYGAPAAAGGSFGAPPAGDLYTFATTSQPAAGVSGSEAPVSRTFGPPLTGETPGEQAFTQAAGAAADRKSTRLNSSHT